jgi:hypothetical protein
MELCRGQEDGLGVAGVQRSRGWIPQRQYAMETVDEGKPPGRDERQRVARPGQSGEGARSALERWIEQERRRTSQLPRESDGPGPVPEPAP